MASTEKDVGGRGAIFGVAERLRTLRAAFGPGYEILPHVGIKPINRTQWDRYEKGSLPSLAVARRIAAAAKKPVSWVYSGRDDGDARPDSDRAWPMQTRSASLDRLVESLAMAKISDADREECLRLAVRMIGLIREDPEQRAYLAQTLDKMAAEVAQKVRASRARRQPSVS